MCLNPGPVSQHALTRDTKLHPMVEPLAASAVDNTTDGIGLLGTCVQQVPSKDTELRLR